MGRKTAAYTGPFLVFILFLGVSGLLDWAHVTPGGVKPIYLVFPLQTLACAGVLAWFWRDYKMAAPRQAWLAAAIGLLVLALWLSPQLLFHRPPRLDGFNPGVFAGRPALYWTELVMRFLRLAIVVPLLEEIFWRGFLLRYVINEHFDTVPFGAYTFRSNLFVAIAFMLEHSTPDWPAAIAAGLLYNFVAYRTKSLSSCALAHGLTNALLGAFIMATHQWGFW